MVATATKFTTGGKKKHLGAAIGSHCFWKGKSYWEQHTKIIAKNSPESKGKRSNYLIKCYSLEEQGFAFNKG